MPDPQNRFDHGDRLGDFELSGASGDTDIANAAYAEGYGAAQNEAKVATNPSPPEEGVRLTGEFVAKRNPDGEIEHHFNSEGDADVQFAATPEAIPLTGPVTVTIATKEQG